MFRFATSLFSPGGERGRLSAFIFHRVLAKPDPLLPSEPDAEQFDRILGWIGSQFNVLPPLEACERLFARSLPPCAAIITFDDGYCDNHDVALPLLLEHRMKAAFFIATGYLNGGTMFNDRVIEAVRGARSEVIDASSLGANVLPIGTIAERVASIARLLSIVKYQSLEDRLASVERIEAACGASVMQRLMMTETEVLSLNRAGMEVGGHTRHHPILRLLSDTQAAEEVAACRQDLADLCGVAPALFAYPNGRLGDDFDHRDCELVTRAGFSFAFTTHPGAAFATTDPVLMPRHTPWARTRMKFMAQSIRNLYERTDYSPASGLRQPDRTRAAEV